MFIKYFIYVLPKRWKAAIIGSTNKIEYKVKSIRQIPNKMKSNNNKKLLYSRQNN